MMECLHERNSEGLVVKLWEQFGEITITVKDERTGENFAVEVKPTEALDAFYHPFAYFARKERADRASECLHFDSNSD